MDDVTVHEASVQAVMDAHMALVHALSREQLPGLIQLDLTMGQMKALMALSVQPGVTVGALAETLNVGKPTASILVDRLVQLGYAARTEDAEDRRRTLVTLSAAGDELASSLQRGRGERFTRWLREMETEDLAALERGLRALTAIAAREADAVSSR